MLLTASSACRHLLPEGRSGIVATSRLLRGLDSPEARGTARLLPHPPFIRVGRIVIHVPILFRLLLPRRIPVHRRVLRAGDDGRLGAGDTAGLAVGAGFGELAGGVFFGVGHLIRLSASSRRRDPSSRGRGCFRLLRRGSCQDRPWVSGSRAGYCPSALPSGGIDRWCREHRPWGSSCPLSFLLG
ncbi:hypothetical protein RHECNPAF_4310033 [Rhizobium etli CNPAF512]|nr:hypothetical protein RHECNPAF_4310033 [Rhizobium etli CNPAF512]